MSVALDERNDPVAQRAYRKAHHRFHFWTNAASAGAGEQPCPEWGHDSAEGLVDEQQMARGYRSSWSSDSSGGLLSTTPPWFHGERGSQDASVIEWVLLSLIGVAWVAWTAATVIGA